MRKRPIPIYSAIRCKTTYAARTAISLVKSRLGLARLNLGSAQTLLRGAQTHLRAAQTHLRVAQTGLGVAQPHLLVAQPRLRVLQIDLGLAQTPLGVAQTRLSVAQLRVRVVQTGLRIAGARLGATGRSLRFNARLRLPHKIMAAHTSQMGSSRRLFRSQRSSETRRDGWIQRRWRLPTCSGQSARTRCSPRNAHNRRRLDRSRGVLNAASTPALSRSGMAVLWQSRRCNCSRATCADHIRPSAAPGW